jgi:tRNA dimethylallyltransferase
MQLITILGQTSSGKSDLAIELSKYLITIGKKNCIVGCDSRQVYKGLNIGTGKVEGQWICDFKSENKIFEHQGIPHFMIDFVDPELDYNLQDYISDFYELMLEIKDEFDFVILVGGTGLYAKAITEKLNLGIVKSKFLDNYKNYKQNLQSKPISELQDSANKLSVNLNNSDYSNKVRLVSNLLKTQSKNNNWLEDSKYYTFVNQYLFAIQVNQSELKSKIESRLKNRFNQGLIAEIEKFRYLGEDKFLSLGLEYRLGWLFTNDKLSQAQLQDRLLTENIQYAKRQLTWLKKQKNLIWIRNLEEILTELKL